MATSQSFYDFPCSDRFSGSSYLYLQSQAEKKLSIDRHLQFID